ncbi:NAD(P)H-hydrate dehydratase [Effusibacillus dendaii]|uniref:Bifunctional NAD(P)H-hydrate repair enzyme n=1 Tax=Effusibacillus dendaii TaxID=2743772 RepID=A0A7I8DDG2_9BACL|nr:NAD(P)H-hydrate dehydratase [Effusibacillus dendaii]BCJ86856.1 bifunctional NAD(P)H-hydrate repair enzyme Nnr [Effusibacillus dendaii]
MHVVTSQEMRQLDHHTIDKIGIPALVLMENAGRETARVAADYFAKRAGADRKGRWLILAGKGNNGADAVVAARHLAEWGHHAEVVYAEPPETLRGDAAVQRDIAVRLGISCQLYQPDTIEWQRFDAVLDGLLGTGSKGAPRGPYAALIREANKSGLPILAVDIPSGLDADNGSLNAPCIRAEHTITFAFPKRGLVQQPGIGAAGQLTVVPIGIPAGLADQLGVKTFLLYEHTLRERLGVDPARPRQPNTHKGTYGHVLVAAGSRRMSGAGILCTKAALRSGCGLVTWAVPDHLLESLIGHVPEAMLAGVADEKRGDWSAVSPHELLALMEGKQAVVIGPGIGRFSEDFDWMKALWEGAACPLVIDADGLNMLADHLQKWPRRQAATVLTPHPGEMSRLMNLSVREIQADRIGTATQYAVEFGVTLVLKGAQTVIATPDGTAFVNTTGNPGMATGGMGDVLAGLIAGLLAQGHEAKQAACLGVWLHGRAGDQAAEKIGQNALLAGDLIHFLT